MGKIRNDIISLLPDGEYSETYIDMWEALITEARADERQAMLDALPEKYGLHIVKEMEELKEETKNMHPSSNAYKDIERSRSLSMGRKIGFNDAIDLMESAIKKRGGEVRSYE